MCELARVWSDLEDLSISDAGYLLIHIDPYVHHPRILCDDDYRDWTMDALVEERVESAIKIVASSVNAASLPLCLDSRNPDNTLNVEKSRITKQSFIDWCYKKGHVDLGDLLSATINTPQPQQKTRTESKGSGEWHDTARKIAQEIRAKYPKLSQERIAGKVFNEMTRLNSEGEANMTGRSGKVPSADTIKRHAMRGI